MSAITEEQLKSALPEKVRKTLNPELIQRIDAILDDPDLHEAYRENLLSYASILNDGKFKVEGYVHAIKYCTHKMSGKTNLDAFSLTFPDKIERWTQQGVSGKDMASYITAYNKSKMVLLIMEQAMVPVWLVNQANVQQAINVQVELMLSAKSEKVRSDAANSVLTHLKQPEAQKIELDIGVKEDTALAALRKQTQQLVAEQRRALESGMATAKEVAHAPLIVDAEFSNE